MSKVELLAPAGDLERLKFAFLYGADAVYIGGQQYSLRANAQNFSLDEISQAVTYAHNLNKKVYVTVNIIFHNEDLTGLKEYLIKLDEIGVDAVIASDITVIKMIDDLKLNFETHVSTQASILNYEAVNFYKRMNVKRVVLARESNKENIKMIKDKTNIDIEAFVHGAMCTSISGKCVLSNYMTKRDSNRGGCAQICRWVFDKEDSPSFTIMPKDLNMIMNIKQMIEVGVNSFKIEGRMRSIYYIATVVLTYRKIIDKIIDGTITDNYLNYSLKILNRCANRDSASQFFDGLPTEKEQYFLDRSEASNQDFLGLVLEYDEVNKLAKIEQRNHFKKGDVVEFFGPDTEYVETTIHTIFNEQKENEDVARHPLMICYVNCPSKVNKFDMMRIKIFDKKDFI